MTIQIAVVNLSGQRFDDTSVILEWSQGGGITQYSVVYELLNGTLTESINFTTPATSLIVPNLFPGEKYRFTVYVGNDLGLDFLNGPEVEASTMSENSSCL